MKKIYLAAVYLILVNTFGQTKSEKNINELKALDIFFNELRQINIGLAKKAIENIPNGENKLLAENLITLISGNKKKPLALVENNDIDTQLLYHFNMGYYNQLDNNVKTSYQEFSKAIQLADINSRKNPLKFSLISMLNLLRKQFFIGDDNFIPFLNHYREIANDKYDERLIILFEIGLQSNEKDDMESYFQGFEKIEQLDSLFLLVSESNPIKAKYYFEKAVQLKLAKQLKQSMELFRRANLLAQNQPVNKDVVEASTWHIATLHLVAKQMDSSIYYWEKSKKLSEKLRNKFYNERLGSWIFDAQKQFDSAYFYLNKSNLTEALLEGKNQRFQSSILAIQNQTEKLKLDKLRLDNRRITNQNWLVAATLALVFGAGIAILVQKNTTKKRKLAEQETLLKQERVDNLLKQQELVSIDAMIEGQEKERQRVANELHDDLGSLMATIKLHFGNVKGKDKDPALKQAQSLLEEAYQKVRGIAHSKNSGVMSSQGLLPAVKKMAQVISETNALEVSVEDFGMGERMENSLELSLFRTIQELVANAIKHAEATKLNIQISQYDDNLNIIIEDNGKGFDRSNLDKSKTGMGLTNIEKRIEHLEGNFTIDSVLGKGTSIIIDIPV